MRKLKYPKQQNKILVGITVDNEIVYAGIEIGSCENNHFTITHDTLQGLIKESEGEDLAKEYLEDGELWKMAVEGDSTTLGLDEWTEQVLSIDGWEHIIGDLKYLGSYDKEGYYIRWASCGASIDDLKKEYKHLYITPDNLKNLIKSDKLHLKDFRKYNEKEKRFFEEKILPLFTQKIITDEERLIPLLIEE